ncbi:unnamed protein product, partial [Tetraodon nigroviridis]
APASYSSSGSRGLNHDYVFVTPVEVSSDGGYLSHDVSGRRHRTQRSLSSSVHYRLSAFGRDMQLDLHPSSVVGPGFTVQSLGSEGITTVTDDAGFHSCLYQGFIRNLSSSSAALSTCSGLVRQSPSLWNEDRSDRVVEPHALPGVTKACSEAISLIRMSQEEYLIAPLPQHLAEEHSYRAPDGHHPHVIYKRSAEHVVHRRPSGASSSRPVNPYLQQHRHHQQLHQHQQQQHRHDYQHAKTQKQHFCGRRKQCMNQGGQRGRPIDSNTVGGLNVETLVVADRKMLEKHGRDNVTTYVLTVMNMVSSLFKDGTIGTDINIVVVGLLLLEEDPLGLTISHHADQSLNSFCQWQSGLLGKGGKRHDHAVLLTGLDICSWKNEPCDTLGFAPISGMCSKYRSCTINEDTGLGLAFTIAHESGHNFGMIHDGEGNPCRKTEGNIMSPTLAGNNGVFFWSTCSRQYLSRFLGTNQASCLVDEPKQIGQYKYPEKLPGQLYDADTQCKWQFGSKAKLCSLDFVKDICKSLWCHRAGHRCETKFMPAAEGTTCGPDMWCRRGQCVKFGEHGPKAVHGQWSAWSQWSDCSRTCGGGVMYRERSCTSPRPQNNGKFCPGSSRFNQLCNTRPCPPHAVDFRAQQCAEHNSKPFRGWYYKWKPYTKVDALQEVLVQFLCTDSGTDAVQLLLLATAADEDICKLYCIAEDFDFFFAMSSKVKDGTPCSKSEKNVCIEGVCEAVGCDQVLGSQASLDACGICKGDNSTCKFFKGQYTLQHRANEYYTMVIIPAGARSVHVQEMEVSTSYLAVRSMKKKYYLTGDWTVDWPGKFHFGGTTFDYQRSFNKPESLYAAGPTNETLVFELGACRLGSMQSLVWSRSADQAAALPEEGDLSEGGGGGTLPVPHHLPSPGAALSDPDLPPRMEHWILVTVLKDLWPGTEEAERVLQQHGPRGHGRGGARQHVQTAPQTQSPRDLRPAALPQERPAAVVSRSVGRVLQVLWIRLPEKRASLWGERPTWRVCGLPRAEVQERCQTSGGSPTGLQPRSLPRADPRGPQQNRLQRCGSRLVLISMATELWPGHGTERATVHGPVQLVPPGSPARRLQSQVLRTAVLQILLQEEAVELRQAAVCGFNQASDVTPGATWEQPLKTHRTLLNARVFSS